MYLPLYDLVVTNEHVVRDSATVVIGNASEDEQLAEVLYTDAYYDLAFLRPEARFNLPDLDIAHKALEIGAPVIAMGQHFGQSLRTSYGKVIETEYLHNGIAYILHDAWQEAIHSGGPLFTATGRLAGINMYDIQEGKKGQALSLPTLPLLESLTVFSQGNGRPAARCFSCQKITFEVRLNPKGHCPNCGAELILPNMIEEVEPTGVNATIESIITTAGHNARLARRGPNLWMIKQGSANIQLTYHEESGLVTGDAYLCSLPEIPTADLFEFLLRENHSLRQLTFSTYGREIVLSLLIYDRYLTVENALPRFEHLFAKADDYDDVLVGEYGGKWR